MIAFADVVTVSDAVAATSRRNDKKAALAALLETLEPDEVPVVIGMITGEVRQGRIGIGWAAIRDLEVAPAPAPTLTVLDVDRAMTELAAVAGPGSQQTRSGLLADLFGRATAAEADYLGRVLVGEIRTGALGGIVTDAVAAASAVPAPTVRRAVMLAGDLAAVAQLALAEGRAAVEAVGLEPGRAVQPMLASTSESVAAALDAVGEASVEWKLDGARIQVHKSRGHIRIFTRNLNDVTDRMPEVVARLDGLDAASFVLDGEVLGFAGPTPDSRPQAFQDTMSRFGRSDSTTSATLLTPHLFDIVHLDGRDLIDEPLRVRRTLLEGLVDDLAVPGVITSDPIAAQAVLDDALARGHEGVMVKAADSPYEAGRRGKSWRKVKPVHLLDLVVIGVEWGSGRRRGLLSNIHLGARDEATDTFVMVGKTFKGMTDEMLAWQTARFSELEVGRDGHVVWVRPEQVVEVAVDGAQSSSRYPGGVALRFARVKRYRDDKPAIESDTLDAVRTLLPTRSTPQ